MCSAIGRAAAYAPAFDIDWEFGDGKVRIPVLGDEPEPVLTIAHLLPLLWRAPLPTGRGERSTG